MRTRLVRIGNSMGVRLPKPIIAQAGFSDDVELHVAKGKITISNPKQPRQGWAEAAAEASSRGNDDLLDEPTSNQFDEEEWTW